MALLDTYQDPGLEIDLALSPEDIAGNQINVLQAQVAIVLVTSQIPRRLSDASREELALDKRRARRVLHVLRQCLTSWDGKEREATDEERMWGAQLDWSVWAESHEQVTGERLRYVATWAKRTGHLRFGKSAVVKLTQELEWMAYALRD